MTLSNYKNILWDFDGVIIDSMPIRELGFVKIFEGYDKEKVEQLVAYHRANGGMSRFAKIRYFFEELLHTSISEEEVYAYADRFSEIMRELLCDKNLLIRDCVDYIAHNAATHNYHLVSASAQDELRFLAEQLGIAYFFKSIVGSPTKKADNIKNILAEYGYAHAETCLIGDSHNDEDAAGKNDIQFFGYNAAELEASKKSPYIKTFSSL